MSERLGCIRRSDRADHGLKRAMCIRVMAQALLRRAAVWQPMVTAPRRAETGAGPAEQGVKKEDTGST